MSSTSSISITVNHRGTPYEVTLPTESTLASLQERLEELTSVPPSLQKLIYKGKKAPTDDEASLTQVGIKDGMKVQMLGSTMQEVGGLKEAETERQRVERIKKERALKPQAKLRSTGSSSSASPSIKYIFHRIEPLPHLPNPSSACSLLQKLADDPAVQHIMEKHKFSVGTLTELAPHEIDPGLLGLNKNAGETILLRLRTDEYDGFRLYRDIRMVLCHELSHNVHGDHDNKFKELNSQLNREVAQFENATKEGTHYLNGGSDFYEPSSQLEAEAQAHILGGSSSSSGPVTDDSREERRRRVLDATMKRLKGKEEEFEKA